MQPFHEGPYATLYLVDNKIVKGYQLVQDEVINKRSIYSCDIAVLLGKLIPEYVPKAHKFTRPGKVGIIYEKVEGITLSEYITEKKTNYTQENVFKIVENLQKALFAMHKAGYGHFDFHGKNILVKEDYTIILIDFDKSDVIDAKEHNEPLLKQEYLKLKYHIAHLIFPDLPLKWEPSMVDEIKGYDVTKVIGYTTNKAIAIALYDIFTHSH